jgi:hypothetical protein
VVERTISPPYLTIQEFTPENMADTTTQAEATQPEVSAPVAEATTDTAPAVEATKDELAKADQTEEADKTEKNGDGEKEGVKESKDDNTPKTRAHGHHHDNKSKYDPSVLAVTDDPQKIRVQVRLQC